MTAYLQRLLGRAAGLAAAPAAGDALRPILQSQSPVVGFDQRLADPALAEDFAILGASPEGADSAEPVAEPVAGEPLPDAAPPAQPRKRGTRRRARAEEHVAIPDAVAPQAAAAAAPVPPAEPSRSPARDATPPPRLSAVSDIVALNDAPEPATPQPASRSPSPRLSPAEPPVGASAPQPALRTEPAVPARALQAPPRQPPVEGVAVAALRDAQPAALVTPMGFAPQALPFQPEPVTAALPLDRQVSAPAEPVIAPTQPLPPLPQTASALSRAEIEQIVRDTIGAERTAQPAAAPTVTQRLDSAPTPAPRPATAAEASVIGKLESSTFRPMLFGVRRR